MTGVRARLKRILGINPETPEPLGNQKKYGLAEFPTQIRAAAHVGGHTDLGRPGIDILLYIQKNSSAIVPGICFPNQEVLVNKNEGLSNFWKPLFLKFENIFFDEK